jgi:hypothetical protein
LHPWVALSLGNHGKHSRMSKDHQGTSRAGERSTLRPFLLAAILVLSGVALMEWDDQNQGRAAKLPIQVSQAR